jgi:hypothetical protein
MVKRNIITAIVISLIFIAIIIFPLSLQYLMPKMSFGPQVIFTISEPTHEVRSDYEFNRIESKTTRGYGLPKESRNIFACSDNNRDPAYWLVFELPKDKIPPFVKKIIGKEFESLTDGILSKHSHINKDPRNSRDGYLGEQYWDLSTVENGRRFEDGLFYFGVDTTRGKIFLCRWSM